MSELRKSIWIDAPPEVVFSYLTDAEKVARWFGVRAELDPVPGGVYRPFVEDAVEDGLGTAPVTAGAHTHPQRLDMGVSGVVEGTFYDTAPVRKVLSPSEQADLDGS